MISVSIDNNTPAVAVEPTKAESRRIGQASSTFGQRRQAIQPQWCSMR